MVEREYKQEVNDSKRKMSFYLLPLLIIIFASISFMFTTTLRSPNTLNLQLPSPNNQSLTQQTISISISEDFKYYLDKEQVTLDKLKDKLIEIDDATIMLNVDKTVSIDSIARVMNIVNDLNLKMILATKSIRK